MDENQSEVFGAQITVLSVVEEGGVDVLAQTLSEGGRKRVLVLYDPGSIAVARALAANQKPSTSVLAWKEKANALLAVYRANRQRVTFACAASVEAEPEQLRSYLSRSSTLPEAVKLLSAQPSVLGLTAWQLLLAAQTVAADLEAVLLDRELELAALPFSPQFSDPDEAFSELEAAASARALLIRQLANVRNELRDHFVSAAAEASRSTALEKQDKLETRSETPPDDDAHASGEKRRKVGIGARDIAEITNDSALKLAGELYGLILHRDADAIGFAHYYESLLGGDMRLSSAVKKIYMSEEFWEKFLYNQSYNKLIVNLLDTFLGPTEYSLDELVKYRRLYVRDGFENFISIVVSDSRCSYIDENLTIPAYIELK